MNHELAAAFVLIYNLCDKYKDSFTNHLCILLKHSEFGSSRAPTARLLDGNLENVKHSELASPRASIVRLLDRIL